MSQASNDAVIYRVNIVYCMLYIRCPFGALTASLRLHRAPRLTLQRRCLLLCKPRESRGHLPLYTNAPSCNARPFASQPRSSEDLRAADEEEGGWVCTGDAEVFASGGNGARAEREDAGLHAILGVNSVVVRARDVVGFHVGCVGGECVVGHRRGEFPMYWSLGMV